MRYEDASHTGAFQGQGPIANDDTDQLAAGAKSTATGNLITGDGTQTGATGADSATDGHITAIAGKGGEDSSFSGGKLSVMGEYGKLSVDAEGNYVYQANKGVENVRDRFTYTLADHNGATDTATLILEIGKTPFAVKADAQQVVVGPDGVVTLPAGVELSDVHVVGRNLVVDMPDGSQMIIIDGAVFVPQLVLGGVEVPATNVAALLIGQEVQPAAGEPTPSSGGNFETPVPPLDPGVPLGDLIPPTEYNYHPPEPEPTFPIEDSEPEAGAANAILDDDAQAGGIAGGVGDDDGSDVAVGNLPGSGGDGSLEWSLLATGAPAGFSYVANPDGSVDVFQDGNPDAVLHITVNPDTGAYEVDQLQPIAHPAGGDENNVSFVINYTVTDDDGDVAPGTLTINVDDDTPTVDVSADSDANVVLLTQDAETDGDPTDTDTDSTSADFGGIFSHSSAYGADGAGTASFTYALSTTGGAANLSSHGVAINLYEINGVIVGSTAATEGAVDASNTIFDISVDSNTGVVNVNQYAQIDHTNTDPTPTGPGYEDQTISLADGAVTLTQTGTVTDGDGDTVTDSASVGIGANIQFADDGPSMDPTLNEVGAAIVDESAPVDTATIPLVGGYTRGDDPHLSGELAIGKGSTSGPVIDANAVFGADGPAAGGGISYDLDVLNSVSGLTTTEGTAINLVELSNGVVVGVVDGTTTVAFAISIDSGTGVVTVEQYLSIFHSDSPDNFDEPAFLNEGSLGVTVTASDFDGDSVTSDAVDITSLIRFEDDGPSVDPTVNAGATVTVDETLPSNTPGINTGDIDKGDDPDLPGGLAIGQANSGSAIVDPHAVFGADGPASSDSISYSLDIMNASSGLTLTDGTPIDLQLVNGVIVGVVDGGTFDGQAAFAIAINSTTGVVTVEQYLSLDHPVNPNPNDPLSFGEDVIGVTVTATDGDGDQITSDAVDIGGQITFLDDGPAANDDSDTVDNITDTAVGNVITGAGTAEGTGNADNPGADGFGHITGVVSDANDNSDTNPAGGFTVVGDYGTLQMDANGQYTYTRDPASPGAVHESFTYTYVDGDGDPVSAVLTINIDDSVPSLPDPDVVHLDDDVIPGLNGNPDGVGDDDPDTVGDNDVSGTLVGVGGDGDLDYYFSASQTGLPAGFTIDPSSTATHMIILQSGTPVLTIDLNNETGDYTVTQIAAITHPAGLNENNISNINISVYTQDIDGSQSPPATLTINVDDDTPTVSANAGVQLDDDALAGGNAGGVGDDANATNTSGTLAHSYGADGAGSIAYLTTGAPAGFSYALQGNGDLWVMQGATHVLTLTVNATTGAYTVTQVAPIDHAAGLDENNVSFTISYNVTDHDGDSATGSIVVNVDDDTPTVSANAAVQLDDDALAGGNAGGVGDANPDTANTSGTLAHSYGADGAGSMAYLTTGAPAGFSYALQGNGDLWIMQGATHVITLTVNATTGAYTVTQVAPIAHAAGGDENDASFTVSYQVTDHDGDTATGSIVINVDDDTPTATIVETGQSVSVDESVGVQVDSNDTTNAGVIALFSGVTNTGTDTHLPQYAQNASAVVASTGSSYGADGAGTTVFSLNVSAAGVDSGLNTTDGHDILLYKEGNLIVGRVSGGADDGKAALAISINPTTGVISTVEYLSIQHPNAANPDDSVSIVDGAVQAIVTVTDSDGDSASQSVGIGSAIQFQDSGPVMTSVQNMNIQNSGDVAHTAAFAFNLGADGANTSNDVITNVTGGATVGGVAVQNWTLTPGTEDATTASYSFSFDYPIGGGSTAHETGTLVFDKAAGTYTIDLTNPIQGVTTILQTATGTLFQGYEPGTSTPDGSQPAISVTQIQDLAGTANDIYVQFTSVAEPSSGTGDNNLEFSNWVPGANNPAPVNGGGDTTWNPGQVFNQTDSWVSTSNDANGVAGDTIQGGEVLDFNLVQGANPTGILADPSTYAQATSMFLKFDGIGSSEDMIVVLKVYDTVAHTYSTVALMVQNSDIQKGPGTGPGIYSGITLDQNDGLIVIEPNDYQQGNTNLVIVGAQIAGSDEGLSGTALDFTYGGVLGVASTGTQAFSTDVSDGPFKISSIGFTSVSTTPQNAQLDFNVTVTDGDGDSITQHITATVTTAADSTSAATIPAANTTVAPVVLDLNGDGVQFLATDAGVRYDFNGDGVKEATAWAGPADGILIHDANGNGTVDGASEFVFGANGATDLQGLAAQYGATLDANDADFAQFGVWQDANSNGVVDAGEFKSLAALGITSINLTSDGQAYTAAGGDVEVAGSSTYTSADGSTGAVADAAFLTKEGADDQRALSTSGSNTAIAAAVAAAGLAASQPAAANDHADHGQEVASTATDAGSQVAAIAQSDAGEESRSALGNEVKESADDVAPVATSGHSDGPTESSHSLDSSQAPAAVETHAAANDDQGPAAASANVSPAAPAVAMISAEALLAATQNLDGGAKHNGAVEKIVIDALAQGHAPATIDAMLNAIHGENGIGPAIASLASPAAGAVSGWDMASNAGSHGNLEMLMKVGAEMLHHDMVQPTHNG